MSDLYMATITIPVAITINPGKEHKDITKLLSVDPHITLIDPEKAPGDTGQCLYLVSSSELSEQMHLLKHYRETRKNPIIGLGPDSDLRIMFSLGCADFICLPLTYNEIAGRIYRRGPRLVSLGNGQCFSSYRQAVSSIHNSEILSETESRILNLLVSVSPDPLPRLFLIRKLFPSLPPGSRYPDIVMGSLRKKLASILPETNSIIQSIRGIGYAI